MNNNWKRRNNVMKGKYSVLESYWVEQKNQTGKLLGNYQLYKLFTNILSNISGAFESFENLLGFTSFPYLSHLQLEFLLLMKLMPRKK